MQNLNTGVYTKYSIDSNIYDRTELKNEGFIHYWI